MSVSPELQHAQEDLLKASERLGNAEWFCPEGGFHLRRRSLGRIPFVMILRASDKDMQVARAELLATKFVIMPGQPVIRETVTVVLTRRPDGHLAVGEPATSVVDMCRGLASRSKRVRQTGDVADVAKILQLTEQIRSAEPIPDGRA